MSDDFVGDLELELTAAARRRAAGAGSRAALRAPRPGRAFPVLAAAALAAALVTVAALIARGGEDRAPERGDTPPPAALTVPVHDSLAPVDCGLDPLGITSGMADLALLRREQGGADRFPSIADSLPVRTLDHVEVRRALADPAVFVVPVRGVAEDGRCGATEGEGYCLVELDRRYRCFPRAALGRGEVLMRLSDGQVAGIVPDGVRQVSVDGIEADVRENAYLVPLSPQADSLELAMHVDRGCAHGLSQLVADRLPLLGSRAGGSLPPAGMARLEAFRARTAYIDVDAAVPWGERDGLAIWIVPAVSREAGSPCAPADGACLVALPADADADAECVAPLAPGIKWAPLPGGRTMVFGFAERDESALRVIGRDAEASVPARHGVAAGVIPFGVPTPPVFEPVRDASVSVVVVGTDPGDADDVVRRLERAGFSTRDRVGDGLAPGDAAVVWWHDRGHYGEATEVARLLRADDVRPVDGDAPRAVAEAGGDVVVELGTAAP